VSLKGAFDAEGYVRIDGAVASDRLADAVRIAHRLLNWPPFGGQLALNQGAKAVISLCS
jgi:hypothetical protein